MATTDKQFDLFCEECGKWIDRYNLNDWNVTYFHGDLDDDTKAECEYNVDAMQATLSLQKGDEKYSQTDDDVRASAHHEVLELLLAKFECYSKLRDIGACDKYSLLNSARHEIINRLMHHECSMRENMRALQAQLDGDMNGRA